jgi:alcohol dehydrogenase (cytochrome c)
VAKHISNSLLWRIAAVVLLLAGAVYAAKSTGDLHWRLHLAHLKEAGGLPEMSWLDIVRADRPQEPSAADVSAGGKLFEAHCTECHGPKGSGGSGPTLAGGRLTHGTNDLLIFNTISSGIPGTDMPGSGLPQPDRWRLVAYVKSITAAPGAGDETKGSTLQATEPVKYDDILAASSTPERWLTYSGSYDSHRFSSLSQINSSNVKALRLLWMRQYTTAEKSIEASPLVVDGYMFVTAPPNRVEALDSKTGALLWSYDHTLPQHIFVCCGYVNRGLAVLGQTLFLGTLDAHLVALDIRTGHVAWDVEIADHSAGFSITGAPLAVKGLVVTGVAGGDFGVRGFVVARDAKTGKEAWRFNAIPEPGQLAAETWKGNAWKTGGAPTWLTGSYDPSTNLIYWPTGNPSPSWDGDAHAGDNLYTNSLLALDADRGTLRWHFQFTPHDEYDWDATEIPILLDADNNQKHNHLVAQANRNGFFYLLDRETGQYLKATPFAKQTWADAIDANGRPVVNSAAHPTPGGTPLYPGVGGATNWQSPSYSPVTRLLYVTGLDRGGTFYKGHADYHKGELFLGGFFEFSDSGEGFVRALDPLTGEVRWDYRNPAFDGGGLLSTAGGVVFGSYQGNFYALDAETGRELWRVATGGRVVASPVTFSSNGAQMVTIAAGHDLLTFGL